MLPRALFVNGAPWIYRPIPAVTLASPVLSPELVARLKSQGRVANIQQPPLQLAGPARVPLLDRLGCGELRQDSHPKFLGRDRRGRFLTPTSRDGATSTACAMTDEQIRARLRRLYHVLPKGAKLPLARLCGFRGEWALQSLRGIARGRAWLLPAVGRRIGRLLVGIDAGQIILRRTGQVSRNRPTFEWARVPIR